MANIPKAITDMSTLARVIYDPDTIAPGIPANVVGTPISSSRIDLAWTASLDTGGSGLAGYQVYRNGVQIGLASQNAFSDTGLAPSTAYSYQIAAYDAAGNVSALSSAAVVTTQANAGPPVFAPVQPAVAFCGIAGVRTYTDPTQQAAIGRYNLFVLGISWEDWANSGRDMDTGVVKPIKAASTAPGGTVLLNYLNLNGIEEDANDPRPTWTTEVATRNWRLYVTGASGSLVAPNNPTGATALVNYTDFVPVNPSLEHPYDFGAKYSYNMCLTKSKSDSRFTGLNAGLASSSLDGVFQDNFVLNPQVNGDWNRDGTTEGQGWPSTASPWLAAGQLRYVTTMRSLAPTKYVIANAGDYGVTAAGVMVGQLDGLLCESYMGKSWSWETSLPWTTVRDYYYRALASAANPHMVFFGGSWPDTNSDGSALIRLPTAGGFPPLNTQWQWARYIAATAYLGEGLPAINRFSQGYSGDLAALDWYDFAGGVNGLPRGWLGAPIDALRPTTAKVAKGPIGLFGVEYTNGMVLVNPKGNGTQNIVNADIPGTWKFITGTQDPTRDSGANFSSVSLPERDGLFLQRIVTGQLATGHWVPSKTALDRIYPRPDTETNTWARHHWAYYDGSNSFLYSIPIGVRGGAAPYWFQLIAGPAGMSVGQFYGKPNYGIVTWTPSGTVTNATCTVRVFDQDGNHLDVTWTVSTTSSTSQFVFFATTGNDSTGTGTISNPYQTWAKALGPSNGSTTFPNVIAVFRAGTYNCPTNGQINIGKTPMSFMAFPGETVTLNLRTGGSPGLGTVTGCHDLTFQNINLDGGNLSSTNYRSIWLGGVSNRQTIQGMNITNPFNGTVGGDVTTSIFWDSPGTGVYRQYLYICDSTELGRNSTGGNAYTLFAAYVCQHLLVERCTTSSSATNDLYLKASCADSTIRYCNVTNDGTGGSGSGLSTGCQVDAGLQTLNIEICYNTVKMIGKGAITLNYGFFTPGVHWAYRNTVYGQIYIRNGNTAGPYILDNNVIQNPSPQVGNQGGAGAITNNGTECQAASGVIDTTTLLLTGTFRTNYLYLRGAEIG